MYEPKYLPQLNEAPLPLSGMRFCVEHHDHYVHSNDPNADPLHIHNCLEIFINLSSDVSFLVNNKLYPVMLGNAVISRPGDIHRGIFHKSAIHEYLCIWIDADLDSRLFPFLPNEDFCPLFTFDEETRARLQSLALSLFDACQKNDSLLEKTALLLRLLVLLEKKKAPTENKSLIPEELQQILDDIDKRFAQIRTANELSDAHFISPSTLTRWFRKHLHSSPRDYLEAVKLSSAAALLAKGATVTEACTRSGFSDCSHFIALFKKKFGVTPLQYKKDRMQE